MRRVTVSAAFANYLMLEHKWPALRRVAFRAGRIGRCRQRLRTARGGIDIALVRIVALRARDLAIKDRMSVRQAEFGAVVDVTLQTCVRRDFRIDDRAARAGLDVEASGSMAGLARYVLGF